MRVYLLYRHLLSTCYIPDTGLSTKVTDERPSSLIMLHSLNKFSDRSNRGCLGDMEDCHLFQTKGFLEELRSELSFEEWIEARRKHRTWGGRAMFCAKEKLWRGRQREVCISRPAHGST